MNEEYESTDLAVEIDDTTDDYQDNFDKIDENIDTNFKIEQFTLLLSNPRVDDKAVKVKEQCVYRLAKLYTENKQFDNVMTLLKSNSAFFSIIPKARTAKIVRNILNIMSTVPDSLDILVKLCRDVVDWCIAEKRTFLRQRIEAKLAIYLLQQNQPTAALILVDTLLGELRKLDDKQMLTEVHLTESRIYHVLQNIPKSKASLTASRTAANAIYVVPVLQAEIDEMSGILHCEESDYTTAYSYFLEAFDAYDQASHASAINCLKYMVLCKILNETPGEVGSLLASKAGMKHAGMHLEAMSAIAKAAKARSLEDFQSAVAKYEQYLQSDALIAHHLKVLYDTMLQGNLLKIIHPFSCVEIVHVAKLINLDEHVVVHKLSQMILDKKFSGILDQGRGHLIVYDTAEGDINFQRGSEVIAHMGQAVETLFARAKGLVRTTV